MRRTPVLALAAAAALVVGAPAHAHRRQAYHRPNIVVIETDDQTVDEMAVMPKTRALIGDQGVTFDNNFVTFSLCCPSRATFLTGQYDHNHGVRNNTLPYGSYYKLDNSNTLAVWLQRSGYYTALVGKYLNRYGRQNPYDIPAGWSDWHGTVDPSTYRYYDFTYNDNGILHTYCEVPRPSCYRTDIDTQKAVAVIRDHAGGPLFLWFTPLAPHYGAPREPDDPLGMKTPVPAPRYKHAFAGAALPRPPDFDERDVSDKPRRIRDRPLFTPAVVDAIQKDWQQRRETLLSVDDAVEAIVGALRDKGQLENTLLIFTSDNGYFHGEHRIPVGKIAVYEPSIRVPLLMRWTGNPSLPRAAHRPQMVANIDLAETILAAAGPPAVPNRVMDGVNLLPLWRDGEKELGRDLLIDDAPGTGHFDAIRTPNYVYVEYRSGERELYNLRKDPYELQSQHRNPRYRPLMRSLHARLHRLIHCRGAMCRYHPNASITVRCEGKRMVLAASGHGARISRTLFSVGGRFVALDPRKPFRIVTRTRPGEVRMRVEFRFDRVVTFDHRGCA